MIRVGAQLFVNRHDTPERVDELVSQMAAARFTILRIFLVWDHLEPRPGEWRWEVYDRVFAAAARHGLGVVATLMAVSPPGWMGRTQGLQDVADLDDDALWAASRSYVDKVVSRWKDEPALDSWILWNEPARVLTKTPGAMAGFRRFLAQKYDNRIENLNRLYFRPYRSFDAIGREEESSCYALGFGSRIEQIDWIAYAVENLMEKLRDLAAGVRGCDDRHPVHVNPHRVSQCLLESGQSLWREAEVADFMGFSAHPAWHSLRFPRDRITQSIGMFADLTRSATRDPDGKFWCTELQGGPTLFTAFRASSPTPGDIRAWMWECAASGASAIIFWCFNTREDGYEAGEWSLLNADGSPSLRLEAASSVADALAAEPDWWSRARPEPEVAILCSEMSHLLGLVEGEGEDVENFRNRQMGPDALCGAWLMVSDLGYESAFLDEPRLQSGEIPSSVKILILPGCAALAPETLEALLRWTRSGGVVVADSLVGWKDGSAALARGNAPLLRELFGTEVLDYDGIGETETFGDGDGAVSPGWFFRIRFRSGSSTEIRARWADAEPAVFEAAHSSGRAVRLGTVFFQRYLSSPRADARDMLRRLIGQPPAGPVRLKTPSPSLRLRRLSFPDGILGVVLNTGRPVTAELSFDRAGVLTPSGGDTRTVPAGGLERVFLGENETFCFRFSLAGVSAPQPVASEVAE